MMGLRKLIREEIEHISEMSDVHDRLTELFGMFQKAQIPPTKEAQLKELAIEIIRISERYDWLIAKFKRLTGMDFSKWHKQLKMDMEKHDSAAKAIAQN